MVETSKLATSPARRRRIVWKLALLGMATLATIAIALFVWADSVAARKRAELEKGVADLRAQIQSQTLRRRIVRGTAEPGNARSEIGSERS